MKWPQATRLCNAGFALGNWTLGKNLIYNKEMGHCCAVPGQARKIARFCACALAFVGISIAGQAQQFRAAWAGVFNSSLTSQSGVNNLVSSLVAGHYNVVLVQVLAYMDNSVASHGAMWKSSIVPWSSR